MPELSDAEVFGTAPAKAGAEMSDAEVFGGGSTPAPQNRWQQKKANEVKEKDSWAETLRQLAAGENNSLVGSAVNAAVRAGGGNPGIATQSPQTPLQHVARGAGTGIGIAYDIIGSLAAETGLPEVAAAVKTLTAAKPVATAAKLGAAYGAQTSAQSQYAESGKVDIPRQAMDALAGAVVGGAPNAIPGGAKAAKGAFEGLKDAVTSRLGQKGDYDELAAMMDKDAAKSFTTATGAVREQKKALDKQLSAAGLSTAPSPAAEGRGVQEGIVTKVRALDDIRQSKTAATLQAAKDQAAAKEKAGQLANGSQLRDYITKNNLDGSLSISDQGGPRKVLDYLFSRGRSAPPPAANAAAPAFMQRLRARQAADASAPATSSDTTLAKLLSARKEVDDRLDNMQAGSSEFKVYTGLRNELNAAMDAHAPKMGEFRTQYAAYSEPINDLLQGGNFARKASELQDYVRRDTPVSKLKFEQNPQEVGRAFVNQGEAGATKIKTALGPGADDFARGYFAREIDGANAKQIVDTVDKHKDFLRQFPQLDANLRKVAEQKAFVEGVQQHAMNVVEENFKAGRIATPAQVKASVRGALDSIDKPGSEARSSQTLTAAMDMIRKSGGTSEAGRNMVAGYFSDKLNPIFESAASDNLTLPQTAAAISKVAGEWSAKKQLLVDSGVMTKAHADDMQKVMDGLDAFSGALGKKKTVGEELKDERARQLKVRFADIAAYVAAEKVGLRGYQGVLAERAASAGKNLYQAYKNSTQKIIMESIKDPVMAAQLAQAFKKNGSSTPMLAQILGYAAVPDKQQPPNQ